MTERPMNKTMKTICKERNWKEKTHSFTWMEEDRWTTADPLWDDKPDLIYDFGFKAPDDAYEVLFTGGTICYVRAID